jgi:hypothetical protein
LIFVNGYQQKFYIDNKRYAYTIYTTTFEPNETKTFNVRFTPVSGNIGDTIPVVFIVMLNPEYKLDGNDLSKR